MTQSPQTLRLPLQRYDRHFFLEINTQRTFLQKKNENAGPSEAMLQAKKKVTACEAIKAHWKCDTHSSGDNTESCWRDGLTAQCYAIPLTAINMWADMHVRRPTILQPQQPKNN
jgi:hypothetical protein